MVGAARREYGRALGDTRRRLGIVDDRRAADGINAEPVMTDCVTEARRAPSPPSVADSFGSASEL
jgi:hypothetical protein